MLSSSEGCVFCLRSRGCCCVAWGPGNDPHSCEGSAHRKVGSMERTVAQAPRMPAGENLTPELESRVSHFYSLTMVRMWTSAPQRWGMGDGR